MGAGLKVAAIVGLIVLIGNGKHHGVPSVLATTDSVTASRLAPSGHAAVAIAYAEHQLGCPYVWGGTGPCSAGFDCSGLMMRAWQSAGAWMPRTSQQQWASLRHIPASQVRPGDLVFFPGSDGTWRAPGHVAMVISGSRMIQAYATGTPVEVSPLSGAGAGGIVGFARPGGA